MIINTHRDWVYKKNVLIKMPINYVSVLNFILVLIALIIAIIAVTNQNNKSTFESDAQQICALFPPVWTAEPSPRTALTLATSTSVPVTSVPVYILLQDYVIGNWYYIDTSSACDGGAVNVLPYPSKDGVPKTTLTIICANSKNIPNPGGTNFFIRTTKTKTVPLLSLNWSMVGSQYVPTWTDPSSTREYGHIISNYNKKVLPPIIDCGKNMKTGPIQTNTNYSYINVAGVKNKLTKKPLLLLLSIIPTLSNFPAQLLYTSIYSDSSNIKFIQA